VHLLRFACISVAVGCSDLVAPSDGAWLRREGDDVIVGCYTSRQSWQLRCVDGVWTGTVGLCPQQQHHNDQQFIDSDGGEIMHVSVTYVFDTYLDCLTQSFLSYYLVPKVDYIYNK